MEERKYSFVVQHVNPAHARGVEVSFEVDEIDGEAVCGMSITVINEDEEKEEIYLKQKEIEWLKWIINREVKNES